MLIHNGNLITWDRPNRILEDHGLLISEGRIVEFGPSSAMLRKHANEELLDAEGQYVMPGNICAHTHFYGAFARGMAIPGRAPDSFPAILRKLWWPLDQALDEEGIRYSTLVCLVDAIKHGTTTLIDHHASPSFIAGSLDVIAEAVNEAGLRAVLSYELTDRYSEQSVKEGIAENLRFIRRCRREPVAQGRVVGTFGLHASLTLSERTLAECSEIAEEGVGFHVHVAEHEIDQYDSLEKSGMRVVPRLDKYGLLGDRSIVVHAVHVDANEISLLSDTGTWVTHQPRSNMNNAVGVPEVESMIDAGVRVGLGNDGFSNAMWEEWKAAYLLHKVWRRDPRRMPGGTIVDMAVYNNADLVARFFPQMIVGRICEAAQADLIFVEYHPTTPLTDENLPWHILFGFHESMVTTTIVAGDLLMRNRKLLTLNEELITDRSRAIAAETWKRYSTHVPTDGKIV